MPRVIPPKLTSGDVVRLVSPASTPGRVGVETAKRVLEGLGLQVQVGRHVFDEWGYLAGRDEDRLADFNDALRDPKVRAVIATRGGKGAYRIADGLDFAAMQRDPKLVVGFSEITILHMAILKHCGVVGLHGAPWDEAGFGPAAAQSFEQAVLKYEKLEIVSDAQESTVALTTTGKVRGTLIGGNQDSIATAAGWALPSLEGAILILEAVNLRLGHIDRQLTMLQNSGALRGISGVVVGQYTECGADATTQGNWTVNDVLRDRLARLKVPILGGIPFGHGRGAVAVPIGAEAELDADNGRLRISWRG